MIFKARSPNFESKTWLNCVLNISFLDSRDIIMTGYYQKASVYNAYVSCFSARTLNDEHLCKFFSVTFHPVLSQKDVTTVMKKSKLRV